MKIRKIELIRLQIPLKTPFETAFGVIKFRETLIVKIISNNGVVGYGEAAALHAPIYNHESVDSCILFLDKHIIPVILRKSLNSPDDLVEIFKPFKGNQIAKAGLEFAVYAVFAEMSNQSLSNYIGGSKKRIPIGSSIGLQDSIESTVEVVGEAIKQNYQRIKLKIKPGWDIDLVNTVRKNFPNVSLMVDANSSYNLENHLDVFKQLDKFNLLMIEQPLHHEDIVEHSLLQKQLKTPICLDESINSYQKAKEAIKSNACKIVNIKPARVGGIRESIRINHLLREAGIRTWCGGMIETSIGRAFNLAIASLDNFDFPSDMSPASEYFEDDIVKEGYAITADGYIEVPTRSGLGFTIDENKLVKYTVEKISR